MTSVRARSVTAGFTLIEAMFGVGVLALIGSLAGVHVAAALDALRARAAAQYLAARLHEARLQALRQNAHVAVRFRTETRGISFAGYRDGNRNGVLSAEIAAGVDQCIQPPERLADRFGGVEFGTLPGLPAIDASGTPPGNDPIRFGSSDMASFTASGTSTPGTLYLKSAGGTQLAVRVFGDTGRTRILTFQPATRTWAPL